MSSDFYSKGTIKIKNADGISVAFMPNTDISNVKNISTNTTLTQTISNLNARIAEAAQKGGIKVMYEEPTTQNTSEFGAKTLIGYVLPEVWSITVNTEATAAGEKKAGIPISLCRADVDDVDEPIVLVDWGDGSTSNLAKSDYTDIDSSVSVHEYAEPGIYTIRMSSSEWTKVNPLAIFSDDELEYPFFTNTIALYWFRRTLVRVNNALPTVSGETNIYGTNASANVSIDSGSFAYLFAWCKHLVSIPSNLFSDNNAITNFYKCFYKCSSLRSISSILFENNVNVSGGFVQCFSGCTSLQTIPDGLFDNCTSITTLEGCFSGCTSLQTIPDGLFDNCTSITSFKQCFEECSSLQAIPYHLFDNNTAVTSFYGCFYKCTSLEAIPAELFAKNTAVTTFQACFGNCTSLQAIPSASFNNNTAVTSFYGCFANCTNLINFHIKIGSPNVTTFSQFISNVSNASRLICVPENSTTYTAITEFANEQNSISVSTDILECLDIETWEFTVNTQAYEYGAKTTGIPFHLYNQPGITLYVDWGDGTSSTLTSANYPMTTTGPDTWWENQDVINASASMHTYANPGQYTVTVGCHKFESLYVFQDTFPTDGSPGSNRYWNSIETPQYVPYVWWNRTLVSVDTPLPKVKGVAGYEGPHGYYTRMYRSRSNSVQNLFLGCHSLVHIPDGLFDNNTSVTSFISCFDGCISLKKIPNDLFYSNTSITTMYSCFYGCISLSKFYLKFSSTAISGFDYFLSGTSLAHCVACVAAGSTTANSASTYASSSKKMTVSYDLSICQNFESWSFTIDTEANVSGEKKTAIPFNIYNQPGITLKVDWGDGTTTTSTSSDYTSSNSSKSIHEYTTPGKYTVTVEASNWADMYLDTCIQSTDVLSSISSVLQHLYWFRRTLTSIDRCIPTLCGTKQYQHSNDSLYNTLDDNLSYGFAYCTSLQNISDEMLHSNVEVLDLSHCFSGCTSLQSIPSELFDKSIAAGNFNSCFSGCTSLQTLPISLFQNATAATNLSSCFADCTSLTDFTLKITATGISSFADFVETNANAERVICVPSDSNTYTSLNSFANSSNGIIVSTDILNCTSLWSFTVNTEAVEANEKKSGVPFHLTGTEGVSLTVNWGDGMSSVLTSDNCSQFDSSQSIHEYTTPGIYTITVSSSNFDRMYLCTSSGSITSSDKVGGALYWFKRTLTSINTKLPKMKGVQSCGSGSNAYYQPAKNSLRYGFYKCASLTSIPSDLFENCTETTTFNACFQGCTSLASIPSGLFDHNTASTYFGYCFSECTSLASIPAGLFANNTEVTYFGYCFRGCTSLTSIPTRLFANNTVATSFYNCFSGCTSIASIPAILFADNTAVTTFNGCFNGCTSITSIPEGLFDNNTEVTSFYYCFAGCTSLTSIPSNLFANNTAVTDFGYCFNGCTSLAAIPVALFANNTAVTSFSDCFYGCTSLASIPSGLFDHNTAATSFNRTFSGCTSLASIPSGLFDHNTAVTYFGSCFNGCTSLASIPSGLFDHNTAVTSFYYTFCACSSLADIPSGLFDHNTAVTNFNSTFSRCTSITSIPSNLFAANTAATNFQSCFNGCSALNDFAIHIGSKLVSSCTNFATLKSDTTRTVYVPTGSTTRTSFNNVASSLGLTIIAE